MISIYNFDNPLSFLQARFAAMPKRGHGQSLRLARHLRVHTTLVSQVFRGSRQLTLEQAALTAEFLELTEAETDFFLLLTQLERAGNPALKKNLRRQLAAAKAKSEELVHRLKAEVRLREEERATFYSDWVYSAVRQLTAIPGFDSVEKIAAQLGLPRKRVKQVVDFLLATGLCVEKNGKLAVGPKSTHLEASSPWVRVHHVNWRHKAIEHVMDAEESQLHYSAPMTLSAADARKIRELIVKFLESVDSVVEPSPSEELHCINVDWFRV